MTPRATESDAGGTDAGGPKATPAKAAAKKSGAGTAKKSAGSPAPAKARAGTAKATAGTPGTAKAPAGTAKKRVVAAGAGNIRVTQVRSAIGSKPKHRGTLRALGLRGIGRSNELPDRPDVRGMLARVPHLIRVEEVGP